MPFEVLATMVRLKAILVEDELATADATRSALEEIGFQVFHYEDAVSALAGDATSGTLVDLLVLDRRLPKVVGDEPSDSVGDELLDSMLLQHPDLVSIVFSGHTGFEHSQFVYADRGNIAMANGSIQLDRVRLFGKAQSIEFDEYARKVYQIVSTLDDIQILTETSLNEFEKRLVRRVAVEFAGLSVGVTPLKGGLTEAKVWLCNIEGPEGPSARVVAKEQSKLPAAGGFQALCPAHLTAGTMVIVQGFCGGRIATAQQLAGGDPISLLDLLASDPESASAVVGVVTRGLSEMVGGQPVNIPVQEVGEAYLAWDGARNRAASFGLTLPLGSKIALTTRSAQHGDLHPGNVLVQDGHPVIIDFDSQTTGSELVDGISLLLGPIFHRDSVRSKATWPSVDQCRLFLTAEFWVDCDALGYFETVAEWLADRQRSPRELAAVVAAYSLRQLRYHDVVSDNLTRGRALALVEWAISSLNE